MLVVNTKEIFLLNLHQNRLHFPAERNAFVLDHQHGRRDVTCKPAIHSAIFLQYKIRCFGQFWLRSGLRSGVFFAEKERLIVGELLLTASQFEADCTGLRARQSGTRVNEICRGLTRFPECWRERTRFDESRRGWVDADEYDEGQTRLALSPRWSTRYALY